jgi:hypothetical protein
MRRLPKTHKKLPMKKGDEPDFYALDRANPLPALEEGFMTGIAQAAPSRPQAQSTSFAAKPAMQLPAKPMQHQNLMDMQSQFVSSTSGFDGMSPLRMMQGGGTGMFNNLYASQQQQQQAQQLSQQLPQMMQQQQQSQQLSQLDLGGVDDFDVVPLGTDHLTASSMFGGNMQLGGSNNLIGGGFPLFNSNTAGLSISNMRAGPTLRQPQAFRPSQQMDRMMPDMTELSPTPDELFFHQQQMKMKQMQQLMPMTTQQQMFDRNSLMDDFGMIHVSSTHPHVQRPQC